MLSAGLPALLRISNSKVMILRLSVDLFEQDKVLPFFRPLLGEDQQVLMSLRSHYKKVIASGRSPFIGQKDVI